MTGMSDTKGEFHEMVLGNFVEAPHGIAIEVDGRTFYSRGSCRDDRQALTTASWFVGPKRVHIRCLESGEVVR